MIFISKLITVFILPPGCFIVLLLLLIIFAPKKFKYLLGSVTLLLYLMSIQPVSDLLLKPLEDAYPPLAEYSGAWPQAVVVLGGGTVQGSPEAGGKHDVLSNDAMKRAVYAFTLRDKYDVPFVFSGGKVFEYDQEPESAAAKRLFESLGLPPGRFISEPNSRNTWENARETAKLNVSGSEIKRAILVTSAYHIKRSVFCFENNGIKVIPAPTDYKISRGRGYDVFSFLPSMGSLRNTHLALHEYIGLLYYMIIY
jgi:uncharacterized SAM-binding protein YcdF (DUF218 family)